MMKDDVNEKDVAGLLDVVGNDPYHGTQIISTAPGKPWRGITRAPSNAQTSLCLKPTHKQNSAGQYPPYDGQIRLDAYTHISSGANRVLALGIDCSRPGNLLKGILSHGSRTVRMLRVTKVAHELQRIGPELATCKYATRSRFTA